MFGVNCQLSGGYDGMLFEDIIQLSPFFSQVAHLLKKDILVGGFNPSEKY